MPLDPRSGVTSQTAGISRITTLLAFAAAAVFFIACANVISFLLGRAFTRAHETSLRVAMGARRRELVRELLADSVVISIAGGLCGMLLALWTSRLLPAFLFEEDAERLRLAPDLLIILIVSSVCVAVVIGCGLVPALLIPYNRPAAVLRRESAGSSTLTSRLRATLAIAQMTSCCLLLMSTAFLIYGLRAALQTSASRRLGEPVLATVQAQTAVDQQDNTRFFQQVQQAAQAVAGVRGSTWVEQPPGNQPVWRSFRIDPPQQPLRDVPLDTAWFTSASLKLFKFPPKSGRLFGFEDQTCRVAIVNEEAAAQLFNTRTVGREIQDSTGLPIEIIGVLTQKANSLGLPSRPTIFYNHVDQIGVTPARVPLVRFRAPILSQLRKVDLDTNVVSPNYFEMMGFSLTAGRGLTGPPTVGECHIAVINQEASNLYFGNKPVGVSLIDEYGVRTAIIGVVRSKALGTFERHTEPAIYFPMRQDRPSRMTLIVATPKAQSSTLADLQRQIESVPGRGPAPVVIETLTTHLAHTSLAPLRIATVIIGASAITALLLSTVGLLGTLSDAARQRRRELAIRIALGAQRWRVILQVFKEGGQLAGISSVVGILASLALARLFAHITFVNSYPAWWVWLAVPLLLVLGVLIASILPARRALLINPLTIMRDE